jgi:hypothetical protein
MTSAPVFHTKNPYPSIFEIPCFLYTHDLYGCSDTGFCMAGLMAGEKWNFTFHAV